MSKKMWKKLSTLLLMVVMVLTMSLSVQAAAVKMNKAKATLYPGQKVTLKVTGTSKKAKWSSSNAKVAKVSKGKVTAVKKGKATIKAKVGKKTYTCKITVKAPALSQKKLNVTVGSKATVKLHGTKIKSVSSSNKKVATVTKKGVITGKKTGKCTVTFKGANGKSYKCTVTVNVATTATPAPTATPTPTPITQQVVSTQAELNAALASSNPDLKEVVIEQSGASSFEIPKEDKSDLTLVVNAPNGEVVNNGNFKEIVIKAIASNTFIEKATGNNIIFQAATGRVAIDEGASANIEVNKGESEAPKLDLVNNGTVSELTLSTKADVNVSGKNTAAAIPVTSTASAGGSTISTSQNLNLKAESKVELTLNAGAENTTATVSDAANIPDVKGLGKVPVKDSDSGKILDTVVAEKDETVKVNKVSVSGKVVTAEDKAPFAGASVYLLNYAAGINKGNVSQYLTEKNM